VGPSLTLPIGDVFMRRDRLVVKVLSSVLYEVLNHKVSVDVAFKRACKGRCADGLDEREKLYSMARELVSDYLKVLCVNPGLRSYGKVVRFWLSRQWDESNLPPWCRLSYQRWFYEKLASLMGGEVEELLGEMNRKRWWLRINTLKASEEKVLRQLDHEGVEYEVDKHFPYMVFVKHSPKPVRLLKPVKEFKAIPQDKASAAVVSALNPEPGDVILDMAAAPGMKTSLIMMLAENQARVIAVDISYRRLLTCANLLMKLGVDLSKVHLIAADSRDVTLHKVFDKVLLDAPCSNSGAVSKDPGVKIHLTPSKVMHYSEIQRSMIRKAVKHAGGLVVYSTCSIMPEEGEEIVAAVRDAVKLIRKYSWASPGYRVVNFHDKVMRFFPHKHLTEAFFLAVMEVTG